MSSLNDLFIEELKDLYNAENQLLGALPKMARAASNDKLRHLFQDHLDQTRDHIRRLDEIFDELNVATRTRKCHAMHGIIEESRELMDEKADAPVMDAGLIGAAQKVEHYEIAGYGTARTFAKKLGQQKAEHLLTKTLAEEQTADRKLTELAEQTINQQAASGR